MQTKKKVCQQETTNDIFELKSDKDGKKVIVSEILSDESLITERFSMQ